VSSNNEKITAGKLGWVLC